MKRSFQKAASPYLVETSRESRSVRGAYFLFVGLGFCGVVLSLLTGGINI